MRGQMMLLLNSVIRHNVLEEMIWILLYSYTAHISNNRYKMLAVLKYNAINCSEYSFSNSARLLKHHLNWVILSDTFITPISSFKL